MDVLNTLNSEINEKHLSQDEKIRYIYLRTCELFSYDYRYWYVDYFGDRKLGREILKRKIDLNNVTDFNVICLSVSKEVLKKLIKELAGQRVRVKRDGSHYYAITKFGSKKYALDPAINFDLARVKAGLSCYAFAPIYDDFSYDEREYIRMMDENLGFKFRDYVDVWKEINNGVDFSKLLDESKCKYHYSDADFFMRDFNSDVYRNTDVYFNRDYDMVRLYAMLDKDKYYALQKDNGVYVYGEITKDKYLSIKNNYVKRK